MDKPLEDLQPPYSESKATITIKHCQGEFKKQGFDVGPDGLLLSPFDSHLLQKIAQSAEEIKSKNDGIIMPTPNDFYKYVLLAASLYPQRANGTINYLFGRGVAIEAALRGEIKGRQKNPYEFSFRGHSDFDLYGVDYNVAPDSLADLGGRPSYPSEFVTVFGYQEVYPPKATKALRDLPKELLYQTAEEVNLGGIKILIPEIELLAIDKLLTPESTPRSEGYDAYVLALQYDLDYEKMLDYYEKYVAQPQHGPLAEALNKLTENYLKRLYRRQNTLTDKISQRLNYSSQQARAFINRTISSFLKNPDQAKKTVEDDLVLRQQAFDKFDFNMLEKMDASQAPEVMIAREMEQIDPDYWVPINASDLDESEYTFTSQYHAKVSTLVSAKETERLKNERARELLIFINEIKRLKKVLSPNK